jgi:hypothetical protein
MMDNFERLMRTIQSCGPGAVMVMMCVFIMMLVSIGASAEWCKNSFLEVIDHPQLKVVAQDMRQLDAKMKIMEAQIASLTLKLQGEKL